MAGNRILYFYLVVLSFVFFVLFDLYLLHLLFIFLLLLPVLSALIALPVSRVLRYRIEAEEDIVPKGRCSICLTVENPSRLPCAFVRMHLLRRNTLGRVRDHYADTSEETVQFAMGMQRTVSLHPLVRMAYCGKVELSVRRVAVCDMLGLISIPVPKRNERGGISGVYVLPELQSRTIPIEEAADLGLDSATYSTGKAGGDPSEIFQLRDYREGDARHSVHWKLSSRMHRLIVREFGLPLNPSLHFLLELREGSPLASAEQMLGTALALSEYLMAREIVHGVSWLSEDGVLYTASVTDADTLAAALHALLTLPAQKSWSSLVHYAMETPPQSETHLVYLIAGAKWIPSEDAEAERVIGNLMDTGACRRMTLMPDVCSPETANHFRSVGCEVQLLDGSAPEQETEAAL